MFVAFGLRKSCGKIDLKLTESKLVEKYSVKYSTSCMQAATDSWLHELSFSAPNSNGGMNSEEQGYDAFSSFSQIMTSFAAAA